MSAYSVGARLDRLPVSPFHRRVFFLVAVGMLFEGFDIYIAASVLGVAFKTGFSTLAQNGMFISATFVGMTAGAFLAGFFGDRYGRRRTYQFNLVLFGAACLASVFAPNMTVLIVLRFLTGLGLGAENVVGFSIITEFFPQNVRGRWSGLIATCVTSGLPVSALLAWLLVPTFGWRVMFLLGGVGALVAWFLRRGLPESPRWLESMGRHEEAEALMASIEREAETVGPLRAPEASPTHAISHDVKLLFRSPIVSRLIVGCICLMVVNTLIYGFVTWLPTFFVSQGQTITRSTGFTFLAAIGGPIGSLIGAAVLDLVGRKRTIVGAGLAALVLCLVFPLSHDAVWMAAVAFLLIIPIYVLVAALFAVYVPEQFPTELRLRGVGICNAAGRSASIVVPTIVAPLFQTYGVGGVLGLMGLSLVAMIVAATTLGEADRETQDDVEVTLA